MGSSGVGEDACRAPGKEGGRGEVKDGGVKGGRTDVNGLVNRERALAARRELASLWRSGQLIPLHDVHYLRTEYSQIFPPPTLA